MGLSGRYEDPDFDVLRDQVPHNGLQVRLLQAEVQEDEILIQVPIPDGEEGPLDSLATA